MNSHLYTKFQEVEGKISTDSRKIEQGAIFFALRGENFDGNKYAMSCLESGAAYAVVDQQSVNEGVVDANDPRIIVVNDTLKALQDLATEHRGHLKIPIFALTGSNGKTTTKELTRAALSPKFKNIGCTQGNLNNHIGVPLTILTFNELTEIGIVEMGANHLGEIAQLCQIAQPNVGLITNIGRAHLEGFGGGDGVRKGKGELFDYLQDNKGVALYNSNDVTLLAMADDHTKLTAIPYSGQEGIGIDLALFGAYNQYNAAAALAVANYFRVDLDLAKHSIAAYTPSNNRSQIIEKTERNNRLIADCYNANPSSMEAAVTEFLNSQPTHNQPSKVLILGAMRELGKYSQMEHQKLWELSQRATKSYFVGHEFQGIVPENQLFQTATQLSDQLTLTPITNSTILLKGSRLNELETLINKL